MGLRLSTLGWVGLALAMEACSDDDELDSANAGRGFGGRHRGGHPNVAAGAAGESGTIARSGGAAGSTGLAGASGVADSARAGAAGHILGISGAAGVATGGVGVAGCASDPACDDGNPCTQDCGSAGNCLSLPLDGIPCNDGLLCTIADRCVGGTCLGTRSERAAQTAATLRGFGGSGFLITEFLSEDLLVIGENVFDGARLSLVRISPNDLQLMSQVFVDRFPLRKMSVSDWVWEERPAAHLVALGEGRVALIGGNGVSGERLDLFQVKEGQLEKVSQGEFGAFPPDLDGPRSASGRGNQLWYCSPRDSGNVRKQAIRVDGTIDVFASEAVAVPGMRSCRGTVLSQDGTRLYVAGDALVAELDVSGDKASVHQSLSVPGRHLLDLQVTSEYLAFRSVEPLSDWGPTGLGDVKVLRRDDFTKTVASYPVEGTRGTLLDFALTESGLLLKEGGDNGCAVDLRLYDLATGAVKSTFHSPGEICSNNSSPDYTERPLARSRGQSVVGFVGTEVFRLDPSDFMLKPLTAPGHGGLQQLLPISHSRALALGHNAATLLDLSSSASSPLTAGGRNLGSSAQQQLVLPAARLMENRCPFKVDSSLESRVVSVVRVSEQGLPVVQGSLRVQGAVTASEGALHSATRGHGDQFKLQSFSLSQIGTEKEQNLVASSENVFEVSGPEGFKISSSRAPFQLGVDRGGREWVLVSSWSNASDEHRLGVTWLTRSGAGIEAQTSFVTSTAATTSPNDIGVAGKLAVIVTPATIWVAQRTSSSVVVTKALPSPESNPQVASFEGLLGFDGETAVVGATWKVPSRDYATGALAFRVSDWTLIGIHPSEERAVSLVEVGDKWVVGSCNSASVVTPTCRAVGLGGSGGEGGRGGEGGEGGEGGKSGIGNVAGLAGNSAGGGGIAGAAGSDSRQTVFPWAGELVHKVSSQVLCGGSLVSERWWLTAAECVVGLDVSSMSVRLGGTSNVGGVVPQSRAVARSVVHPDHDPSTRSSDLALLELASAIDSNSDVCPIALASMTARSGDSLSLSGWGTAHGTGNVELGANVGILQSSETCAASYDRSTVPAQLRCVDLGAGASCRADLGGASSSRTAAALPWEQVGIVSWVAPDCRKAVLTPLSAADLTWISNTAGPLHLLGDVDGDHVLSMNDVERVIALVGSNPTNCRGDVNHDGTVDSSDYEIVVTRWMNTQP